MNSKRFTMQKEDWRRFGSNALIFLAPALLVFLTTYQASGDLRAALVALEVWALNTIIDLIRKFVEGK